MINEILLGITPLLTGVRENVRTGNTVRVKHNKFTVEPDFVSKDTVEYRIGKFYYVFPNVDTTAYTEFQQKCSFCGKKKFMPCKSKAQAKNC